MSQERYTQLFGSVNKNMEHSQRVDNLLEEETVVNSLKKRDMNSAVKGHFLNNHYFKNSINSLHQYITLQK